MRKVLIGTPCYDGKVDCWFAKSLFETSKQCENKQIYIHAIYVSYDSLIQRARNRLIQLALDGGYDDIFFIDSDCEWEPEWFFRILERPEPIVGAPLIKKGDKEGYTVRILNKNLKWSKDKKLIEVNGVGTGFMKISRFALEKLWQISTPYDYEGSENRMVFDIKVENGELISEDYVAGYKWQQLGYRVWVDPTITINHVGIKKFEGDFSKFLEKLGYV